MAQINTNTYSLNSQRNLANNSRGLASALERLSSGLRVNSAKDDASGLATGMNYDAAARVTAIKVRQAGDAISASQIADGAMAVVGDIVTRIIELNQQGGGSEEIKLLTAQAKTIQDDAKTAGGSFTSVSVTSGNAATALTSVANERIKLGAKMNNQEYAIQALRVNYENQSAARSRIMDADFAEETSRLSRFQILQQAGTAMVAQANAVPQNVLSLLR